MPNPRSDGEGKIHVDASRPATLNSGAALDDYATLHEAITAWRRLSDEQKRRATIRVIGGPLYAADVIPRLYYGLP
jgi:hypothetical protein